MPNAPTLRDVAKLAQVSVTAASWALNNKPGVSEETRTRVREAAMTLGYQQQIRALTGKAQLFSVVGVLGINTAGEPLAANPFYSHVLAAIERECRQQNLTMVYTSMEWHDKSAVLEALPSILFSRKIDGALIIGAVLPDNILQPAGHIDLPVVLINGYAMPDQPFDKVLTDNFQGAYTAVSYLIQQGHTKIGLIGTSPDAHPSIIERREGYIRALHHHGITDLFIDDGDLGRHTGYNSTTHLLKTFPEITAIFASIDNVAIGALNAIEDLGLSVPDDVSVMGFDDIDWAREVKPALTTMQIDKALMGRTAVRCLVDRAGDPDRVPMTILLGTRLVVRKSVRTPR